jgi:hypothetical protein
MFTSVSCVQDNQFGFDDYGDEITTPREQANCYWPFIPQGVNAVEIIAISRIIARHCGEDAASVYLIEAATMFLDPPLIKTARPPLEAS